MREAGKGDTRRPEDKTAFDEGYTRIFSKKVVEMVLNDKVPLALKDWSYEADKEAIAAVSQFYNISEQETVELFSDEVSAYERLQRKDVVKIQLDKD